MKLKRLLTFVFGACAAVTLCSCDEENKPVEPTPPVEEGGNTDSGNTGGNTDSGNTGGNTDSGNAGDTEKPTEPVKTQGDLIVEAVEKQIEASNTITLTTTFEQDTKDTYWSYNDSEELVSETYENKSKTVSVWTIAKTEDSFAIKMVNTFYCYYDNEVDSFSSETYILDGYSYIYDETGEFYVAEEIEIDDFDDVSDIIEDALSDIEITTEDKTALLDFAADLVDKTIDTTTNKITLTTDVKPIYTAISTYINSIDGDAKTLEAIINDALALADPTLRVSDLIDAGVVIGKMTVNEALAAIDEFLTENYQTTIQGIYDSILVDETFVDTLTAILVEEGLTEENVAAMLEQYKAIKIADLVADYKDITLYDLALSIVQNSNSTDEDDEVDVELVDEDTSEEATMPTIDEAAAMIKQMIAMPINQLNPQILADVKETLTNFKIEELKNIAEIEFNSEYQITKIKDVYTFSYSNKYSNYYDQTKFDIEECSTSVTMELVLSNDTTTIALPDDAVIINAPNSDVKIPEELDCFEYWYYFECEDVTGLSINDFKDDDKYDLYINLEENYDGINYIRSVWLQYDSVSEDGSIYTFNILECRINNCDEAIINLAGPNLEALSSTTVTVTFDRANATLSVDIPTIDADKLQEVLNKYL